MSDRPDSNEHPIRDTIIASERSGSPSKPETVDVSRSADVATPSPHLADMSETIIHGTDFNASASADKIFGDYELLQEIARGGMGVVYRARQTKLNRIVALKMILGGQLASPADVQRFYAEAEAAAKLDHPGIVPIYEVGQQDGQHYFSMAFVEGQSLAQRVQDGGPLASRDAAQLVGQIAKAVEFAHNRGVIHRDLKPANVLLAQSSQPKVTDFGLAKQADGGSELTATGQILGTPGYMPPEQAAGEVSEIDARSDVYSLGAILYCLLTGRPPFQSATLMGTLQQVLDQEPVSPRQLNNEVDADLETICLKCLQKQAGQRYQTAQQLADDLQRYLAGDVVLARPISQAARVWRWCKRNRTVATLTATVAVSLIVGIAISSYFAIESHNRATALGISEKDLRDERNSAMRLAADKASLAEEKTKLAADEAAARELAESRRIAAEAAGHKERKARLEAQTQRDRAEKSRTHSEWLLYASQISRAQMEWKDGDLLAARRSLESCQRNLRGWEYDYMHTLFNRNQQILRGHTEKVVCLAVSPDGRKIVSGG